MSSVTCLRRDNIVMVGLFAMILLCGVHMSHTMAIAEEWSTPTFGGPGGTKAYNLDCGRMGVMVGLTFKSGSWIDEMGVVCRKVSSSNGRLGEEYTRGPVGGVGGDPKISKCMSGGVIGSVIDAQWGQFVNHLVLGCYEWDASRKRPGRIQKIAPSIDIQVLVKAGSKCGLLCNFSGRIVCPSGKAGKALRGKYGSYIDSTRFVCDAWDQ